MTISLLLTFCVYLGSLYVGALWPSPSPTARTAWTTFASCTMRRIQGLGERAGGAGVGGAGLATGFSAGILSAGLSTGLSTGFSAGILSAGTCCLAAPASTAAPAPAVPPAPVSTAAPDSSKVDCQHCGANVSKKSIRQHERSDKSHRQRPAKRFSSSASPSTAKSST